MTSTLQSNLTDTTYNGWANYETWNVALWIGNNEFLYTTAKACVKYVSDNETPYDRFVRCMHNTEDFVTGDNVRWDDDNIDRDAIVEMMEEL